MGAQDNPAMDEGIPVAPAPLHGHISFISTEPDAQSSWIEEALWGPRGDDPIHPVLAVFGPDRPSTVSDFRLDPATSQIDRREVGADDALRRRKL